ncbi:pyrroline-5-carboxylate reductase [Desulfohalovibrio reitneri]|uniref:pyrroline-5-carboxylate reductase n=1 Tax=Desulfohalovibrio reitneri TaxID=1307759 RepID=UPI0004A7696A|nr:pyrroline-5-carboxylate reductase [Desulfohalovibrio reitneri]
MASIGFIGTGNMGSAIIKGLSGSGYAVHGVDADRQKLLDLAQEHGLVPHDSIRELVDACRYVVLAVKPQQMEDVLGQVRPVLDGDKRLISIAAGLPIGRLREWSDAVCPVIRVMPNTPALAGKGVTAICLEDEGLDDTDRRVVVDIFSAVGEVYELAEKDFDAFTALVGSGPAYVFHFMEALMEAGVSLGLPRDQATGMVLSLLEGTAAMAKQSDLHVSQLREMVTSPAGTTIEALLHLDRTAVRGHVADAVRASFRRSRELGE